MQDQARHAHKEQDNAAEAMQATARAGDGCPSSYTRTVIYVRYPRRRSVFFSLSPVALRGMGNEWAGGDPGKISNFAFTRRQPARTRSLIWMRNETRFSDHLDEAEGGELEFSNFFTIALQVCLMPPDPPGFCFAGCFEVKLTLICHVTRLFF